jgi:hypothetical protein
VERVQCTEHFSGLRNKGLGNLSRNASKILDILSVKFFSYTMYCSTTLITLNLKYSLMTDSVVPEISLQGRGRGGNPNLENN